jgi:hypothetical protein
MGALCQSESDGEPVTAVSDFTPARRPSLGQALPKIPVKIEGCGVSITLKAGPHVRWHKLLDKWKSCFPDPLSAPMAWPCIAKVGGEEIRISSIQESISRTIGPERLISLDSEESIVHVMVGTTTASSPTEEVDVAPPNSVEEMSSGPPKAGEEVDMDPPKRVEETTLDPPKAEEGKLDEPFKEEITRITDKQEEVSRSIKVVIESKYAKKKTKLNVSSNCQISRLIRKWTEASGVRIDPDKFILVFEGHIHLDREKSLLESLKSHLERGEETRVTLEALLEQEAVKRSSQTPSSSTQKKRRPEKSESESLQEAELEFWSQMKAAKSEGLGDLIRPEEGDNEWEDDDEALAIALSLSEVPP